MSRVVRYEACPRCRSNGRDNRGDNLVRYADGGGHCFSCWYHERGGIGAIFHGEKPVNARKGLLPFDFTREVPATALKWLLQYGLPYSYWQDQIGYSPSEERLIFLVGNPTQFSIGRLIGEPKEGNHAKRRKWYVWGDSHKHTEVVTGNDNSERTRVCLVEDLVSAHKIVTSTQESLAPVVAVPLFGVQIHPCHLYYLIQEQKPIVLWLDKDQQGTIMKKVAWLQALTGVNVSHITTEQDPKSLSQQQILEALQNA